MPDTAVSSTQDTPLSQESSELGAVAAKYLVTFVFSINACFFFYLVTQFFALKSYGNGLHAIYAGVVLLTVVVLGFSTRDHWAGKTRRGTYLFFGAIGVSCVGNLVSQLFA